MPEAVDRKSLDKKTLGDSDQVLTVVEELEGELSALRVAFEQYFLGVERRPPTEKHDTLKRRLVQLRNTVVRQTAVKFRVQSLYNKYLTYERLWQRTLMEIEAGTYKRDLFKAKLHSSKRVEKPAEKAPEPAPAIAPAPVPVPPPPPLPKATAPMGVATHKLPVPPARAAAGAGPAGGLSEQKIKAIYDAYVMAKKRCNEDTSKITFDAVANTLKKQVPDLLKQHKASTVDFKVVIKDGKAILRALPKE
ncbi:MAG: hypothetical protein K1X64_18900 [Myxococcaceae bacterium]|nr:hypothetical protein [Myxococcaceae bacterium]